MPIRNRIAEFAEEMTAWRRDIHAHPELRFEETRTAALVAEKLRAFGCDEVVAQVGQTGVVVVIHGRRRASGQVVGFRADMDALPIHEQTGAAHASKTEGKMHACGHDGHTTMLLGAMRYLAETRHFDGTVVALFQPAEEGGGGAKAMIADGVFDRYGIDEVYALHNWPGAPAGTFHTRSGPFLAGGHKIELQVTGKGGHGAMPHLAVDVNLAAAQIVTALNTIPGRSVPARHPVVLSVCGLRSDSFTYIWIARWIRWRKFASTATCWRRRRSPISRCGWRAPCRPLRRGTTGAAAPVGCGRVGRPRSTNSVLFRARCGNAVPDLQGRRSTQYADYCQSGTTLYKILQLLLLQKRRTIG
jgi:hypothetical protein